jgi:hypothetical protein
MNNHAKATVPINCIGSVNGDTEIVGMWRYHFDHVYHSNYDCVFRNLFCEMLIEGNHSNCLSVTIDEVLAWF